MPVVTLLLMLVGFAVSLPATLAARALGRRLNAMDGAGVAGQVKAAARRVPNTGGIGVFLGVVLPVLAGLAVVWMFVDGKVDLPELLVPLREHFEGVRSQTRGALVLLGGLTLLHVLGLIDDRRPLGPYFKMLVMLGVAAGVVMGTDSRLLVLLDRYPGGFALSTAVTVVWIVVITNAFNFLDNMDGLAGGIGVVCAGAFLAVSMLASPPQWFVAAMFALLVGSLLGFLVFNFPWRGSRGAGASVFMGDGGSLVVGFLIALLAVRITYIGGNAATPPYHALVIPLVILAVPLYDFCSVTIIRLSQGKSPLVGDLQHFSHRLVRHGLSKRAAVVVICGCAVVTGIGGVLLMSLESPSAGQAALVGGQTLAALLVLGLYEWARTP